MSAHAAVHVIEDAEGAASMLHPLRLRILSELEEPDSAAGLARRLGIGRQQLNYHVRQLEDEGLLEVVGERQRRGCVERLVRTVARSYVISPSALGPLAADPERIADRASSSYLVALAARLIREVASLRERAAGAGKRLPTLSLQSEVRFASNETQHAFAKELTAEVSRLIEKYHDDQASRGRRFRFMAGAWPVPKNDPQS